MMWKVYLPIKADTVDTTCRSGNLNVKKQYCLQFTKSKILKYAL